MKKVGSKRLLLGAALLLGLAALLAFCLLVLPRLHSQRAYTAQELGIPVLASPNDADGDGLDDYTDLCLGARDYIATKPRYKSIYYAGGYPTDHHGVCTDVIWQAFAAAGYNLKDLVDADIAANPAAYPTIQAPDPNIDFRRVRNLKIFFDRYAESLPTGFDDPAEWQAGDIVVFSSSHIAICSDKRNAQGLPFILHHTPMGAREANNLADYAIAGHYRWNGMA